ncbi:unnamed protein product [Hyaloperonospora brassicae]|uniref:Uncharacterized protein n=1 Tax=Hyaloperonospora brassicae TaxID=162125 RepID=A0AAV0U4W0_HYABA|nr:unnamed protein product [Hyaloperonospora brassicae]
MRARAEAGEDREERVNETRDNDSNARSARELCSKTETAETLSRLLRARRQEFEARCQLQLEDHDVADVAGRQAKDTEHPPAVPPIVVKKSKLTQWIEAFEARHHFTVEDKHLRDSEALQASQLTTWLADFKLKRHDDRSAASIVV